jgi:hypothetical protein
MTLQLLNLYSWLLLSFEIAQVRIPLQRTGPGE